MNVPSDEEIRALIFECLSLNPTGVTKKDLKKQV
jgi:hypothetical protein